MLKVKFIMVDCFWQIFSCWVDYKKSTKSYCINTGNKKRSFVATVVGYMTPRYKLETLWKKCIDVITITIIYKQIFSNTARSANSSNLFSGLVG